MNKYLLALVFVLSTFPLNVLSDSFGSSSDDYIWQERFEKYSRDAKNGDAQAQFKIGEMHEKGRGTPIDIKAALNWYNKSADQYYLKARYRLGYLYFHGAGVRVNKSKAYKFLSIPAQNGDVRAQYYLGQLYTTGQGVDKNIEKGLSWYKRSAKGGFHLATKYLTELRSPTRKILQSKWAQGEQPAEFLPSIATECEKQPTAVVECLSGKFKRNIGDATVTYVTKALLFDIKNSGKFKISYRSKILDVKDIGYYKNNQNNKKATIINEKIKVGWQDAEHILECSIVGKDKIDCLKNKVHRINFTHYVENNNKTSTTKPAIVELASDQPTKSQKQLVSQLEADQRMVQQ